MNKNTRFTAIAGAAAAGIFLLSACTGGSSSWQDEVRAAVQADWDSSPESENTDGCMAMQMFDLTDADTMADFVMSMSPGGEVDYSEFGIDESKLNGAEPREVVKVASEVIIKNCDF